MTKNANDGRAPKTEVRINNRRRRVARPLIEALEPRIMFDAAAVATVDHAPVPEPHPVADAPTPAEHGPLPATLAAPATAAEAPAREILFVDTSAPDWAELVQNTRTGVEVVVLDAARDGIGQIDAALAGRQDVSAIHLVSHGADGMLQLGSTRFDAATLALRNADIAALGTHLASGADVLIYGCDVAASASGREFVSELASTLKADVAASRDATGAAARGGNWTLEYSTGSMEAQPFITAAGMSSYADTLSTVDLSGNSNWTAIMYGLGRDPVGDSQAGAADTDIVGDASHGSLYTAFDDNGTANTTDDTLVFRMRIDNPTSTTYFGGVAIVGMDANLDGRIDLFMSVDGRNNGQAVRLLDPGTGLNNSPSTTTTGPLPTGWLPNNGIYPFAASIYSVVGVSAATDPHWNGNADLGNDGHTDAFVSWKIPVADLATVLAKPSPVDRSGNVGPRGSTGISGYTKDTVVSYVNFTQTQTGPINGDLNGVGASYDKNATFASLGVLTSPMTASSPVSASLSVSIAEPIGDGNLSATESTHVTLSGTTNAAAGSTIALTISDSSGGTADVTTNATVVAGGGGVNTWSVSNVDLSSQADGTLLVTASVTYNAETATDTANVALDKSAPVLSVSPVATAGRPTISGTSDLPAGSVITLTLDSDNDAGTANSVVYLALVQAGGAWSVDTSTAQPASGTVPVGGYSAYTKISASGTDAAGNSGTAAGLVKPTVNGQTTQSSTPVLSGTWNYTAGDQLEVSVNGATYTLAPAGNSWTLDLATATPSSGSLGSFTPGQSYDVTATVTRGGSSTSDPTTAELVIATGPAVDITSNGGAATGSTSNNHPTISGTATAGAVVTLRIDLDNNNATTGDRVTYSVVADASTGAWSVDTASALPLSGVLPSAGLSGTVGLLATVTDSANHTATDIQALTITTPAIAIYSVSGALPQISGIAADGILNASEDDAAVIYLTGTNLATSDTIALTVSDGVHSNVTGIASYEVATGRWKATLNLSPLNDGTNALSIAASFNSGQATASTTVSHDSKAYASVNSGEITNTTPTVTGTADVTAATLDIQVDRYVKSGGSFIFNSTEHFTTSTATAVTFSNGSWSFSLPQSGGLFNNSGEYALVTVTGTDAAGNAASATGQLTKIANAGTPKSVAISTIAGDGVIDEAEDDSVTITGTTSVSGGFVLITLSDGSNSISQQVQAGTTASGGLYTWTLSGNNLDTWRDGTVHVEAKLLAASSSSTVLASALSTPTHTNNVVVSPTVSITSPIGDGNLSGTEDLSVSISGAATNAVGQTVTITVSDGNGATTDPSTTAVVQADGTWSVSGLNLHGLDEGQLSVNATLGAASADTTVMHDKTAPVLAITPLASAGFPVIYGSASGLAAGATITITIDPDNDGSTAADGLVYTATVQGDNTWSVDTASAVPSGHAMPATGLTAYAKISADAADAAGNAATTAIALIKPVVYAQTTNNPSPTISGTWADIAGDVLSVSVGGHTYTAGDGHLTTSGNDWTLVVPGADALADNTYNVTATVTRGGSNVSDATTGELVIDSSAPAVAIVAISTDSGTAGDFITNDGTLIYSGTAEAGASVLVTLKDASNSTVFSVTVTATGGVWSVDRSGQAALEAGNYTLTAQATDAAGNSASANQNIVIDQTGPAIGITSNSKTTDTTPLITGTTDLPPGSVLTIEIDPDNDAGTANSNTYTAIVQADGTWSVDTGNPGANGGSGPNATYASGSTLGISASGTDAAGNTAATSKTMDIANSAPSITISAPLDWNLGNSDGTLDNAEDDAVIAHGSSTGVPAGSQLAITITDGTTTITDTVTVGSDGSWEMSAINLSALGNGVISVTATYIDGAGDSYAANATVLHDKSGSVSIDGISQDSGAPGDFTTSDRGLVFYGSASPNASVQLTLTDAGNAQVFQTTVNADANGNWSYDHSASNLADGSYTLAAVSGSVAIQTVTVDGTAPAGPVSVDALWTHDTTPTLTGTAQAGAGETLSVTVNGVTYVDGDGNLSLSGTTWTLVIPAADALDPAVAGGFDGIYSVTATLRDLAGNSLSDATSGELRIDTTAPAAPSLDLEASSDSGVSDHDDITNVTAPVLRVNLSGSGLTAAAVGDLVQIHDGASVVGSATLASGDVSAGFVNVTLATLAQGTHNLTADLTDPAGNTGSASAPLAVLVDTAAPLFTTASANGTTLVLHYGESGSGMEGTDPDATDFSLTVGAGNTPVSVTAASLDASAKTVTLTLGSAIVFGDSNILLSYTPGTHPLQDVAGNTAAALSGQAVNNDTPVAGTPTQTANIVSMTKDTGTYADDFLTADGSANRTVSGTISAPLGANEVVEVSFDGGSTWTQAVTVATDWSVSDTGSHGAGWTIVARVTNTASSLSGTAASQAATLDTSAPAAPSVALTTDSGSSGSDRITNTQGLTPGGVESGALIEYSTDGTNWSSSAPPAAEGSNTVYVRQTDVAGNTSAASAAYTYTLDTTVAAPSFALANDTGSNGTDGVTNDGTVNVTLASDVASWQYSTDGGANWTSGSGTSFTLAEGTYAAGSVLVRQTDIAGNTSSNTGNAGAITVDNTTPAAPGVALTTDTGASNSDRVTNTAGLTPSGVEAGATLEYSTDGTNWSTSAPTAAEGSNTVYVRQTDVAGNTSAASSVYTYTLDTTVAAPSFALVNDTGGNGADGVTNDGTVNVTLASDVASWEYSTDGGANWNTGSGSSFTLAAGTYAAGSVLVRQTDIAGNLSSNTGNAAAITVDATAPAAPGVALTTDTGASGSDRITHTAGLTPSGVEAGATLEYSTDGTNWS
ncbi:MAG: DUF4347 domain-containing protein, partial [Rhodocyclaceae bacterium]|nr:DUF4347 domain-containing protein [Rhodocyclaceae bacterium]